jgi:hypothetical protein
MPIRFSTEAANADFLVEGKPATRPSPRSGAQASSDRYARPRERREADPTNEQAGKPGKDINAAGYLKDKDRTPE